MTQTLFSKLNIALVASLILLIAAPLALADHTWGKYHWERSENPRTLQLGSNVASQWDSSLALASSDWSESTVLSTTVVPGGTTGAECDPTSGMVEVCSAAYGTNGWLGIAQIWASRKSGHIAQGLVKVNDTYYSDSYAGGFYNTPEWRNFVMCQEIGHTFGLDHQDENFENGNLSTCMDYTSNPSDNQHPNQHDYDMLEEIYAHLDGTGTTRGGGNGNGKGPNRNRGGSADVRTDGDSNDRSDWGRLVREDAQGKQSLYVREDSGDDLLFTFVTWADHEEEHTHERRTERSR